MSRISAEDLKEAVTAMVAACPALGDRDVLRLLMDTQAETQEALAELERAIGESGGVTDGPLVSMMVVGAVYEVLRQLPGERGQAVAAGVVLGRLVALGYARRVAAEVAAPGGKVS